MTKHTQENKKQKLWRGSKCRFEKYDEVTEDDTMTGIDRDMLRDDAISAPSDVPIRIIFTIFSVASILNFMTMILGFVPYWLLLFDETRAVALTVHTIMITLCCVFYFLMAWQRKTALGIPFAGSWALTRLFTIGSLSAIVRNIVPIYFDVICFSQSATIVVYTYLRPKYDNNESVYIRDITIGICAISLCVWLFGIYIFISEHAWIYGAGSFVLASLVCAYNWWTIKDIITDGKKYSLSRKDRELASIEYYTKVVLLLWNKITGV